MSSPNALGTFFETSPFDQSALVDLGDKDTDARLVSLSRRVFPQDIVSVVNIPERGVDYGLIGSVDGKPAAISIRGTEVTAEGILEGEGSMFRVSPDRQF